MVFYACRGKTGVGLAAHRFDDKVLWCAVDAAIEGFTHDILVPNYQLCFFRPCLSLGIRRGLLGDVGGDAERQEFVVALNVGDNCIESFCVVGQNTRCGQ